MTNRLLLVSIALLHASSACVVDWTIRDAGSESKDGASPEDLDAGADSESDAARDSSRPRSEGGMDVESPDVEEPPPMPCGEGCGEHEVCNETNQLCECETNYYYDGSACVPDPCEPNPCGMNEECSRAAGNYACRCAQGFTDCMGQCVNLQTDPKHCSACGAACAGALSCGGGACEQPVHQLVLGDRETCALLEGANGVYPLKCWGYGSNAFYRDGAETDSPIPRDVVGVAAARGAALSDKYRCVVHPERDDLLCWGTCAADCGGSAGAAPDTLRTVATDSVRSLAIAKGVFMGATCALTTNGTLNCRGMAQLVPDQIDRNQWISVPVGDQYPRFKDVSGRYLVLCGSVADDAGRAACWGLASGGELGAPPPTTPTAVYVQLETGGDLQGVVETSSGFMFGCAVIQSGKVYCWGRNDSGMLGHGDADTHSGAVEVMGVAEATHVVAGGSHACALVKNGDVYCWGFGIGGGLGDAVGDMNSGAYFSTAQRVPSVRGVIELRAGNGHTCARLRTGAVLCWGANDSGQVGDGSFITRNAPVPVRGLIRGLP